METATVMILFDGLTQVGIIMLNESESSELSPGMACDGRVVAGTETVEQETWSEDQLKGAGDKRRQTGCDGVLHGTKWQIHSELSSNTRKAMGLGTYLHAASTLGCVDEHLAGSCEVSPRTHNHAIQCLYCAHGNQWTRPTTHTGEWLDQPHHAMDASHFLRRRTSPYTTVNIESESVALLPVRT
jgi:hypothetical protein